MTYPYITWDWPTQNLGHIGPDQYDTLSTIPAWSAIGKSVSTGSRFNDQYQAFLNVIMADTSDPQLRQKIVELSNLLTTATNRYDRTVQQAHTAHDKDSSKSKPEYTAWLGNADGQGCKPGSTQPRNR